MQIIIKRIEFYNYTGDRVVYKRKLYSVRLDGYGHF